MTAARLAPAPLLRWFDEHARDLPWRHPEAGAWGVLVSEVMLQQTPVVRVLPVYRQWLHDWPTPSALAEAGPGAAVRAWGRLGYPRRALRLHAAAQSLVDRHDGQVPDDLDQLLALPGVGEYTARAVAAFAFGRRVPVVDTNVLRVLNRVERGRDSIREAATRRDRDELDLLLPATPARAARFSAAIMELGALVCTAASPDCPACPLQRRCAWVAAGSPTATPKRAVQTWHGTDRQLRGQMVGTVRADRHAVAAAELLALGEDPEQARRCLDGLVADGLLVRVEPAHVAFPT